MPGGLYTTTHADSSQDFSKNKMDKIVVGREGKKKYPVGQCKVCAVHNKRCETRYISKFCVVPLHNAVCLALGSGVPSINSTVSTNICSGLTFKHVKCLGTGVYLIKGPSGPQCFNPYPTAFPYGNGMVLHFYQQQESSTTKTVHKVINKGLKAYV